MPKVTYNDTAPTPDEIRAAIKRAGHTRAEFACAVHSALRTAEDWLAGRSPMHPGLWELYTLKTHKRPAFGPGKKPSTPPKFQKGDYVVATKYHDGDPGDHFVVGWYDEPLIYTDEVRHQVVNHVGEQYRGNGFRRAQKISEARGRWLVERMHEIEISGRSVWAWVRESKLTEKPPGSKISKRKPDHV